jgi:hypothetical protein
MIHRADKGSVGSFARGAELWMHQARMFVLAIWTAVIISMVVGAAVAGGYFYRNSSDVERYALERYVLGELRLMAMMTNAKMELYANGRPQMLEVKEVVEATEPDAVEALRHLRNGVVFGALTTLGAIFLISLLWWSYGKAR